MAEVRIDRGAIDLDTGVLEGTSVRLSPNERALVRWLVSQEAPCDAGTLLTEVWGYRDGVQSRTVYSTVDRIRKKIEVDPAQPRHLVTVDGGYRFVPARPRVATPASTFGRDDDLAALADLLVTGGAIGLHGPGGVGKTHLARVAFERCAGRFRETHWVEMRGVDSVDVALTRVGLSLGLRRDGPDGLRRALEARAPLLIALDDLDELGGEVAAVLAALVPSSACTVLLTSRQRVEEVAGLVLEPLTQWAGLGLLRDVGGTVLPDEALAPLVRLLDGLPLALRLAAPWVDELGVATLVEHTDRLQGVTDCVMRSWRRLSEVEQRVLSHMAVAGGSVPMSLVLALCPDAGFPAVQQLLNLSLLQVEQGWAVLLETVRTVVLGLGGDVVEPKARALAWAGERCAQTAAAMGTPDQAGALRTVRRQLDVILHSVGEGPRGPLWNRAVLDLAAVLLRVGLVSPVDRWLAEVVQSGEEGSEGLALLARARQSAVAVRRGGDALAPLEGMVLGPDVPPEVAAACHLARGLACVPLGRFDEALASLEAVRALGLGNVRMVRQALHGLVRVHAAMHEWEAMVRDLGELERLATLADDLPSLAMAAAMRGVHARDHGRMFHMETNYRRGLALARKAEDGEAAAHLVESLGAALINQERDAEARKCLREAGRFYTSHGMVASEGYVFIALGGLDMHEGHDAAAEEHFQLAADAFGRSGFPRGQAAARGMLARTYTGRGELERALVAYDGVLESLGDSVTERGRDVVFALRALCLLQLGDHSVLPRMRALPDEAPFGLLKELAEASASDDPAAHAEVRRVVGGRELDRAGLSV